MDFRYKANRIRRWSSLVGFFEALRFEVVWSCRPRRVHVRVPGYPNPLVIRGGSSDISVFEEVFMEGEFDICLPRETKLIIDGGANVGYSTAFFAHRYPKATVVAVEPSMENGSLLRANCEGFGNVTVIDGGLWPVSGFLRIANPDDAAWSFRCEPAEENQKGAFPAYSVEDLLRQVGHERCDLLKLDIEGAEEQLFADPRTWLPRVDAILVEVHGRGALAAIKAACPLSHWAQSDFGEKLFLLRRP